MMAELGLVLPQRGVFFGAIEYQDLLGLAREVDNDPAFTTVWVGDSLGAKPRPDSLTLLGALAGVTKRVTLGVGCMASFPVRSPIVFAYQWATLDQLSGGRMLLAACTGIVRGGASAREGRPFGVVDKERARRLEENIEICRLLWSGEPTSFVGEFHSFDDVVVLPQPLQDPCPIWIAANPSFREPVFVERAFERIATMADGLMTTELVPNDLKPKMDAHRAALTAAGHDPEEFPNVLYHNINVNEDRQLAFSESKAFLDEYYGPVFNDEMVRTWTAHGSPSECAERLQEMVGAGARGFALRITSWNQHDQYERLVNEVVPLLN